MSGERESGGREVIPFTPPPVHRWGLWGEVDGSSTLLATATTEERLRETAAAMGVAPDVRPMRAVPRARVRVDYSIRR